MRYVVLVGVGAVFALGLGLAIGYTLPPQSEQSQVSASGVLAWAQSPYEDDEDEPEGAALTNAEPLQVNEVDWNYIAPDGTVLDSRGNPLDVRDVTVGPEEMLVNLYDEPVDPRGVPLDDWGVPIDRSPYDDDSHYENSDGTYGNNNGYNNNSQPWYVKAFPGFGQMFQQLMPGQQTSQPILAPQPVYYQPSQPTPAPPRYPQPSCWVSAQPTSVRYGGSSTLTWSAFNASQASLTGIGAVSTNGSRTIPNITQTRDYTLSVRGSGGSSSCYTRITVDQPSGPPSCIISVHPDTISRGQATNLAWGSQNAQSATLAGVGNVPSQGGFGISPAQSTTYTLTVFSANGQSSSCVARITVR